MSLSRQKFIKSIAALAQQSVEGTGLFASLMIAQACLESSDGDSVLSKTYHNYFGIKAGESWRGKVATFITTEYVRGKPIRVVQAFRAYPSIEAGFKDRVNFLTVNPRYRLHGVFMALNPDAQAQDFVRAGYATDPKYATLLISILNYYKLNIYDHVTKNLQPAVRQLEILAGGSDNRPGAGPSSLYQG